MTSTVPLYPLETAACLTLSRALMASTHGDVAAPIRAGMRARAIADACERLLLPAVLIDARGVVLHVGALARPRLGKTIEVVAQHLVGRTPAARRAVQAAVSDALAQDEDATPAPARTAAGLSYRDPSPVQRLRGVVILGRLDRGARRRMAALQALLDAQSISPLECA